MPTVEVTPQSFNEVESFVRSFDTMSGGVIPQGTVANAATIANLEYLVKVHTSSLCYLLLSLKLLGCSCTGILCIFFCCHSSTATLTPHTAGTG